MKKRRTSFFSDLREKQLIEKVKNDRRNYGNCSTKGISKPDDSIRLYPSGPETNAVDPWSFEGHTSYVDIDTNYVTSAPATNNPLQNIVNVSALGNVAQYSGTKTSGETRVANTKTMGSLLAQQQGADNKKMALSSLSSQFRKFNGASSNDPIHNNHGLLEKKPKYAQVGEHNEPELYKSEFTDDDEFPQKSDDRELSLLESIIHVDDSPVKIRKNKLRRWQSSTSQMISQQRPISQNSSEHLVSQISEIPSTPSSVSPENKTPISIWIQNDRSHNEEIKYFDSPKQNRHHSVPSRHNLSVKSSSSLLENFLAIKTRFDSSVRLFAHDLRKGKYEENTSLNLYIRKVVDRHDKLVQTVAYDLKGCRDRWVIFKSVDTHEIAEKTCLKLYPPWQEVVITDLDETIIIGADFYKKMQGSELKDAKECSKTICDQLNLNFSGIKLSDPMFLGLVPFHIKNKNNIQHQVDHYQLYLNIDVMILYVWSHISPSVVLIKDSADFMSLLEIPKNTEIQPVFQRGQCLKLLQVVVADKICISKKLLPFSVLYLFGCRQTFFYKLKWQLESTLESQLVLDITCNDFKKDLVNIDDIFSASNFQDHRISMKCKIREKQDDYILVTDEESDRSLRIEFVYDTNYQIQIQKGSCEINTTILLRFLRVIHGKVIWDLFTTWEEILDDDDGCDQ